MSVASIALAALTRQRGLRKVDVAFAQLLQQLGGSDEVMLAGSLAMRAVALGHSGFMLASANNLLEELQVQASLPALEAWDAALQESALVSAETKDSVPLIYALGRVSLRRYAQYEQVLAEQLLGRIADIEISDEGTLATQLQGLFQLNGDVLDRQALAAWLAAHQRLTIITGGPGTGKTTTVARLLALLVSQQQNKNQPLRIALAAPTGRAAARLGEAVSLVVQGDLAAGRLADHQAQAIPNSAQTLHRLLGWRSNSVSFRHHAGRPLLYEVVVVDEASMIDLPLMSKLLAAVAPKARLILLGDPDQLPAVEAGNVLGALCAAAGVGDGVPEALVAKASQALGGEVTAVQAGLPLAGHRVHLLRGYRQAGAGRLSQLANAVGKGNVQAMWPLLEKHDDAQINDELIWHSGDFAILEHLMRQQVLPQWLALARAESPQAALQLASKMRVLTALRQGPWGAQYWNEWFVRHLGASRAWFHGRLVMVTTNSYEHDLFNGDTGIAWRDEQGEIGVWFDSGDELRSWYPGQLPEHESAFASTVHKAQGSEFDRVLLLLPERDARVLSRELLYTGLTRARTQVQLWATPEVLMRTVARQSQRDTGLLARLQAS